MLNKTVSKMLKLAVVAAILFGVAFCFPESHDLTPGARIIGGEETTIREHPYQLALYTYSRYICGAVLIKHNWAITTANCVDQYTATGLTVRAGSTRVSAGGQRANIVRIILHEQYDRRTLDHDFALLQIRGSIAVRDAIPIALPEPSRQIVPHEVATITGWGRLSEDNEYPEILHVTQVPTISLSDCQRAYPGYIITATMFCGGHLGITGQDASHGDRGGPVVIDGQLVGLISWAINHGAPERPDVYASIPSVRTWIQENTGI